MSSQLSQEIGRRLPLFERQVDVLVVAIPKDKDLPGLSISLDDFPIRQALWARGVTSGQGTAPKDPAGRADLQQALVQKSIPLTSAAPGQAIDLGQGASLTVVSQSSTGTLLLLS